jgi:hypothetical protein
LCHVCGVINLSSGLFLWFLICRLVQVLFLSLVVNFLFFSRHFPVTTLGLDPFSGTYLNRLLFLWCALIENNLFQGVHQIRHFFAWKLKESRLPKFHASLKNEVIDKVLRKKIVSVNFHQVLFLLLYFLTLEAGTYRLSWNVSKELLVYVA